MANPEREFLAKMLAQKKSLVKINRKQEDYINHYKENFADPQFENINFAKGYAISLAEILDILTATNEVPIGIQVCFGVSSLKEKNRTELILSPIYKEDKTRKYWTTCTPGGDPTDVPCPPYVTDCKKTGGN